MTTQDYLFNTTEWISYSLAPSSRYCVMTGLEGWGWVRIKQEQFDGFSSLFQAWLQNLLGNVITFNSIYKKIEEAQEAGNDKEVYFWYGRFTTLFINFEPIKDDHIDFDDDELIRLPAPEALASFAAGFHAAANGQQAPRDESHILARSAAFNTKERGSPRVEGWFGNSYGFASGLVNASFGDSSPNATICQSNITRILNYSIAFKEQVKNPTNESLADAAVSFENILASAHPITFSCYMSLFEFESTASYYLETMSDFHKVLFNLVHKLGKLYDTIYFLTKHSQEHDTDEFNALDDSSKQNWWFKLGIYYGTVVYLLFYSPYEIDPYDPLAEHNGITPAEMSFSA